MQRKLKLSIPTFLPESADCSHCVDTVLDTMRRQQGVQEVHRDDGDRVCIHYDERQAHEDELTRTVRLAGADVQARFRRTHWEVSGMDCATCVSTIKDSLSRLDGMLVVQPNVGTGQVALEWDSSRLSETDLRRRLSDIGHPVVERQADAVEEEVASGWRYWLAQLWTDERNRSVAVAAALASIGLVATLIGAPALLSAGVFALAMVLGGWQFAQAGIRNFLITRRPNIDLLMTIAAVGAAALGEWAEGAAVVVLFAVGEVLEGLSMERARRSIRSLMALAPDEATRYYPDGTTEQVSVGALSIGDVILVRPGERIPMDGVIVHGSAALDESPITGESMPVAKDAGDEVFAGTINGNGALEVRVTRDARDNTISRIIKLVEQAQASKAESQRFVDRFAEYYTPAVVVGAIALAVGMPLIAGWPWRESIFRALVLLVISCPCALVISTPVSIISAVSNAAKRGVLVKGGRFLEALDEVRVVALDKTGTLTEGKPAVTDIIPLDRTSQEEVLAAAAAAEARSEHPLAAAILDAAREQRIAFEPAREVTAVTGRGVEAERNGDVIRVGSQELFDKIADEVVERIAALENQGKTTMLVAVNGTLLGIVAVADRLRPEAVDMVRRLHELDIERVVLLTGDNERTARAIAEQVGIDDVRANLLPDDKVAAVRALTDQYAGVAMVGDGVNDAPALAAATVGIAMGAAGTDQALEVADVALMSDDLSQIPFALELGRAARRTIKQNVVFSLAIKALFMVLAVPGLATLWMAVLADDGASLLVTFNGLRLSRR